MTALVEVVGVEVPEAEHEALAGFGVNQPKSGSERSSYSLSVRGWAVGRNGPVEAVELVHNGTVLRRLAVSGKRDDVAAAHPGVEGAQTSEFFATISTLGLSPEFEL